MDYEVIGYCEAGEIEVDDLVMIGLVPYKIIGPTYETRQTVTFWAQNLTTGAWEYPVVYDQDRYELLREV